MRLSSPCLLAGATDSPHPLEKHLDPVLITGTSPSRSGLRSILLLFTRGLGESARVFEGDPDNGTSYADRTMSTCIDFSKTSLAADPCSGESRFLIRFSSRDAAF